jgi:RNA polymerase sigma-70 factor (ECF subfamily)
MLEATVLTRTHHPTPDPMTDAAPDADSHDRGLDLLAIAARDGDGAAFDGLYAACAPAVYRYCYARTRNAADAEDLLQQTFLRVVEALPRYEDRGVPFRAWLFRICRTVTIDAHRRRRAQFPLEEMDDLAAPTGQAVGEAIWMLGDVLDAIERLTGDQRLVVQLRFFADLSARETGLAMGRDEAAVRALQARAIASLRRHLGVTAAPVLAGAVVA